MGREISQVMGHLGAGWLERPKRTRRKNRLVDQEHGIEKRDQVAGVGAGSGYFSFRMAERFPTAKFLRWTFLPRC